MIHLRRRLILTSFETFLLYTKSLIDKLNPLKRYYKDLKKQRSFNKTINDLGFAIQDEEINLILTSNLLKIVLRKQSSDIEAFNQVFVNNEYGILLDFFKINNISPVTIVDVGSNIGLTSLKFLTNFPLARIFCLEPDPNNFIQLEKNLFDFKERVCFIQKALWPNDEELEFDFSFRDGKDWSRRVISRSWEAKPCFTTRGIPMLNLINKYNLNKIDLLKIDIEGAEERIFRQSNDLSFLEIVNIIAIEIHDEFNCRNEIYNILKLNKFTLFNSGEITIGIKTNFI
jgi:FkbM family methyltransferase